MASLQSFSLEIDLAGLETKQTIKSYLEVVYTKTIWKAEQMTKHQMFTSAALHVLHRDEVHIYRFMQWASLDFSSECLPVLQKALWESFESLAFRLDSASLES